MKILGWFFMIFSLFLAFFGIVLIFGLKEQGAFAGGIGLIVLAIPIFYLGWVRVRKRG
ncbi:MAG: hypothetical protein J7J14_08635 [Thermotogaceae bacterium]|nr:hypothetical protein [Thermotogaceae bacterium]